MATRAYASAITGSAALLGMLVLAVPAQAERPIRARLVHCGAESCLRLSGHRSGPAIAVRVSGRDLPVEGARSWRATVPLSVARTWPIAHGYSLFVTLTDPEAGTERTQAVAVPPGSLGSRLELASLVVRSH